MVRTASTEHTFTKLQNILELRVAELEKIAGRRDAITVEQISEQIEEIQRASERALEVCNLNRHFNLLRDARAALLRIQERTFGTCQECEEEIHPKRLAAIPWAALCLNCQEAADHENREAKNRVDSDLFQGF
jgi:DnaK suppressor protein